MANGRIAVLAHAFWKEDKKLGKKTFSSIFANIDQVFMDDGYIKGTSFRGVRGFGITHMAQTLRLPVILP